jgi:hypothetical protein
MNWLKFLPMELREIDEVIEPRGEISPGEKVIGEMTEDLKKLFTAWMLAKKRSEEFKLEAKIGTSDPEEAITNGYMWFARGDILQRMFWASVSDEFGLWKNALQDYTTGVRKGFKVVIFEDKKPDIPDFLKRLFGGG